MKKRMTHIYTGSGKGKTTAALGQAIRAIGQGLKVCVVQFAKPSDLETGEKRISDRLGDNLKIVQFGDSKTWLKPTSKQEVNEKMKNAVSDALKFAQECMDKADVDMLILDEIIVAVSLGVLTEEEVISIMKSKPAEIELILTGRGATVEMIELADLVTEMKEIKHPYQRGIDARRGIEY